MTTHLQLTHNKMRLLDTTTLQLSTFYNDIPPYVILSHTWASDAKDEVSYEDITTKSSLELKQIVGYEKVERCCKIAQRDGYQWTWIDTCCIDKRSSSELSEAINSMYRWYWHADICYVFLPDVSSDMSLPEWEEEFINSRWFKRGWTLQELIAPSIVEFYGLESSTILGTKSKFQSAIERATGIQSLYLRDRNQIRNASIGTKFCWASGRTTTRPEDMAYCLLGLVGIHMPMLYGEGERAFYRLQLEIIKESNDHSIFAWGELENVRGYRLLPLNKGHKGTLAPSVKYFETFRWSQHPPRDFTRTGTGGLEWSPTSEMTNRGLRIGLPCIPGKEQAILQNGKKAKDREVIAILRGVQSGDDFIGIRLISFSSDGEDLKVFKRISAYSLVIIPTKETPRNSLKQMYLSAGNRTTLVSQYEGECDIIINPLLIDANEINPTDISNFGSSEPYQLFSVGIEGHFLWEPVVPLRITTKFEDIYLNFGLIGYRSWMTFEDVRRNTSNTKSPVALSDEFDIDKKAFRDHMIETSKLDVRVEVFAKRKRTAEGRVCWNLSISICKASNWGQELEREYVGMSHRRLLTRFCTYHIQIKKSRLCDQLTRFAAMESLALGRPKVIANGFRYVEHGVSFLPWLHGNVEPFSNLRMETMESDSTDGKKSIT